MILDHKSLLLKTLGITTLALALSFCLQAPFTASVSAIFSSPEKSDFTISDVYAQIADGRPVRRLEDRIAVVDIGHGGREEIAEALEILSLCGPKTVGLDINFMDPTADDSRLLDALQAIPEPVLPVGLDADGDRFSISDKPFFYDSLPGMTYGVINLPTATARSNVREYAVRFPVRQDTLPSFVVALAAKYDPDVLAVLESRDNDVETIAYHSKEFRIYSIDEIADHAEEFADKIVLIGAMSDADDMHQTPISSYMPGLMIHVSALSTLLDREWYSSMPRYTDYLLAFIICFLIVLATIGIKGGIRGLIVRILQVILAYCAVRIGYSLFVDRHVVCNFSNTLLMIAFGLFAVDIWNGTSALINLIGRKIKHSEEIKERNKRKK
ncbi:MAG: CHASE2 domain-containing protein [Muribaculaceae bacterium]|nr:CHASE2 domain-containing protein [Muribaculaceae bacterium]